MRRLLLVLFVFLLPGVLAACGDTGGLPTQPGRYTLKEKSVSFDGDRYSFYWADGAGNLHRASTKDVKLRMDDKSALEIGANKEAILHLKQDEPVTVEGRDRQGDFGNFWYPFLIGSMLSRGGGGSGPIIINNNAPSDYRDPVYRYPPTDRFNRGDTISGNVANGKPAPPDYSRLQPTGGTVSGQSGGTGGGNAAINKADSAAAASGQSGGAGAGSAAINKADSAAAASGQSGGAGAGAAAINKSGSFKSGSQGYTAKVDSGVLNPVSGRGGPIVGGGSGARTGSGSGSTEPSISTGRGSSGAPSVSRPSGGSPPRISTGGRRR